MDYHNLGEQLANLRKEKGWSQEQLATKLKVTRQAISNWERDKTQPDLEILMKLAELFETDLDGLTGRECKEVKKKENLNFKLLKWLYLSHLVLLVGYLIFIAISPDYGFSQLIILLCTFLLMATTIYFFFNYAIKSNDYTMLAGYDKRVKYHYPTLKRMIYMIEFSSLSSTLVFSMIFMSLELLEIKFSWLTMLLMLLFLTQFVGGIFLVNMKYRNQVILDKNQQQEARVGTWVTVGFMISILILLMTTFFTQYKFNIHNNTLEAGKLILFLLPYTILNIIALFLEQKGVQKAVKENRPYRLDSFTYFILIANVILLVGMVYTGYRTTL